MRIEINTRTRTIWVWTGCHAYNDAAFESKHPRDTDGKFARGGAKGGSVAKTERTTKTQDPNERSRVPDGQLAIKVDFVGLKSKLKNIINDAMWQNMHRYPFMHDHFSFIGTDKSDFCIDMGYKFRPEDETDAFYQPEAAGHRGQMVFSVDALESAVDREKLFKTIKKYDSSFFYPGSNTPKEIVDHEFGHAIWQQLGLDKYKENPIVKYINNYMDGHSMDDIAKKLSYYASTSPGEFFAEAFSELRNNPHPREIATRVGELLDEHINKVYK